jgi:hypothetical protein
MSELKLDHKFDSARNRHYLNDNLVVLHCHHYATLFTQLALDAREIVDGTKLLFETMEEVYREVLTSYYQNNSITEVQDRIDIAVQLFSSVGMGKMNPLSISENGGEIEMPFAYVDDGWLKKWGKNDDSVNFIGAGYVAGMFSAVFGKPVRTYKVSETNSRVKGDAKSLFKIES